MRILCMKTRNVRRREQYRLKKIKNLPQYESDDELFLSELYSRLKKKKVQEELESSLFSQSIIIYHK